MLWRGSGQWRNGAACWGAVKCISEISRIPKRHEGEGGRKEKSTFILKRSTFDAFEELLQINLNKPVHGGRLWSVAPVIHALHAAHLLQLGAKFIENTGFDT